MHHVDSLVFCHAPLSLVSGQDPGNSQARKFTAAIAMPTPNNTPARTRFEPPSPKAKVRPDTTIATSDSPRAMVLVNAVSKTLTAFSQGELPAWANAGAARINPVAATSRYCDCRLNLRAFLQSFLILCVPLYLIGWSSRRTIGVHGESRRRRKALSGSSLHTWSGRSNQWVSTFALGSSLPALRDTRRRTAVSRCRLDRGEYVRRELPSIYTEAFFEEKPTDKMQLFFTF